MEWCLDCREGRQKDRKVKSKSPDVMLKLPGLTWVLQCRMQTQPAIQVQRRCLPASGPLHRRQSSDNCAALNRWRPFQFDDVGCPDQVSFEYKLSGCTRKSDINTFCVAPSVPWLRIQLACLPCFESSCSPLSRFPENRCRCNRSCNCPVSSWVI